MLHLLIAFLLITLSACGGGGGAAPNPNPPPPPAGSEGTLSGPVALTSTGSLPYSGKVAVSGPSYYLISGLEAGAAYSVTFGNVVGPIIPFLYSSDTQSNGQSCFYSSVSTTGSCIVQASSTGTIFITTASYSLSGSSTYSLNVALAADAGQGTPASPVAIASPNSYNGALTSGTSTTTYDPGNSGYYRITGLTAGHRYSVTLTPTSGSADLYVYQNAYSALACSSTMSGTSSDFCSITAKASSMLLQVKAKDQGSFSITYADYGAVAPFVTQGNNAGGEVALVLDAPLVMNNGSVNEGKSYYTLSGLVPGQAYYTYLSYPTDNINLYVYRDSGYAQLACSSTLTDTKDEFCSAAPFANAQLWIAADGSNALANLGSQYAIGVQRVAPGQGSSTQPQTINSGTELPYRVTAGSKAKSYYKISGLAANTTLMATLVTDRLVGGSAPFMSTFPATGFSAFADCITNGENYANCRGTTNSLGELFVTVESASAPGGTAYINIKSIPASQGTAVLPLAKDMVTLVNKFSGQALANTDSYYALTGLTPNTSYYILTSLGSDGASAETKVFNTFTGDLSTQTAVCGNSWSYLNTGCAATSDASGRLWVKIGSWYLKVASYFNIEALPAPVSRGLIGAPLNITGSLPYRSTVGADSTSFYMVTGLTANKEYLFSKYDTSNGEYFSIYNDSAYTSMVCDTSPVNSGRESICRGKPTGTTVYLRVSNTGYLTNGGYHYLDITPVPSAEGSAASPVAIGSTSHSGSVNVGVSYYQANNLAANTTYTVSLTGVSGDPDLYVFNNATMSGAASCRSIKGSNQTELCQASSDSNGKLWIFVDGELSRSGGSYQIQVY